MRRFRLKDSAVGYPSFNKTEIYNGNHRDPYTDVTVIDLVNSERTNFIYEFNISENRWVLTDTENHRGFLKNQPPTPD